MFPTSQEPRGLPGIRHPRLIFSTLSQSGLGSNVWASSVWLLRLLREQGGDVQIDSGDLPTRVMFSPRWSHWLTERISQGFCQPINGNCKGGSHGQTWEDVLAMPRSRETRMHTRRTWPPTVASPMLRRSVFRLLACSPRTIRSEFIRFDDTAVHHGRATDKRLRRLRLRVGGGLVEPDGVGVARS